MVVNYKLLKDVENFNKIKLISNKSRFIILEMLSKSELTPTQISSKLNLSFKMCDNYISLLEKQKLVSKRKEGRLVYVKSNVKFDKNGIEFLQ